LNIGLPTPIRSVFPSASNFSAEPGSVIPPVSITGIETTLLIAWVSGAKYPWLLTPGTVYPQNPPEMSRT